MKSAASKDSACWEKSMRKTAIGLGLIVIGLGLVPHTEAKDDYQKPDGKEIFQQNCAACHEAGDNNVNPNRPVVGSAKLQSLEQFKKYLNAPKGHMPYYPNIVNDRNALKALYSYCKSLPKVPVKEASI
jgi:mono/diheme cytochrome c family protein